MKSINHIQSLHVSGGFLNGLTLHFDRGLNCVIGARGTGKTTVLEFLRYALDVMPTDPDSRKQLESLVQGNLGGGCVQVRIQTRDGFEYDIHRSAGEEPLVMTADGKATELSLRHGALFRPEVFSQNEVETIADQVDSQLALIDSFDREAISGIDEQLAQIRDSLQTNAAAIEATQQQAESLAGELEQLPGVEEQLNAFVSKGGSDAEAINAAHAAKALRDREERELQTAIDALRQSYQGLGSQSEAMTGRVARILSDDVLRGPNGVMTSQVQAGIDRCVADVATLIRQARERIETEGTSLRNLAAKLTLAHKEQELAFRKLIDQHAEAQGKAATRSKLEKQKNHLLEKRQLLDERQQKLAKLAEERTALLVDLSQQRDLRSGIRQDVVKRINDQLAPAIRVSLEQHGEPAAYRRLVEDALRNVGVNRIQVATKLVEFMWPSQLAAALQAHDTDVLVRTCGLNASQAGRVVAKLSEGSFLHELEVVELEDRPRIELNDHGNYKATNALSTGQKCNTILPILLLDSDAPLLVDQPEDNLDNRFVFETIVNSVQAMKRRRQLIFVTHNPNIPVLGEADQVIVMDSDGSAGGSPLSGTVDTCKDEIVTILEGGVEAFQKRNLRYAS